MHASQTHCHPQLQLSSKYCEYTCASSLLECLYSCHKSSAPPCQTVMKVEGSQCHRTLETCHEPMTRLLLKMMSLLLLGHYVTNPLPQCSDPIMGKSFVKT